MEDRDQRVLDASAFYSTKMLQIDFMLTAFAYRSIKPYFKGKTALEIGPASGYMTKQLVNDFDLLHVVEPSKALCDQIPHYANVKIHEVMIENFQTNEGFDTIIMSHVLEHIEQPVEVLKKLRDFLAPGGVLIVVVPNAKSIHRIVAVKMGLLQDVYALNARDNALGHYRVYDTDSLQRQVIESGYRLVEGGGSFLKPLSNAQIEESWSAEMMEGFYEAGKEFPELCAEIFIVAS